MESFWGSNLHKKNINTPKKILEEQAEYLEKETEGCVFAEVINKKGGLKRGEFGLVYLLKAKYFEDYSYKLFSLSHDATIYPLYIELDGFIFDEVKSLFDKMDGVEYDDNGGFDFGEINVDTEIAFIETLKVILSSKEVGNIVSGIITISDDYI